jgi:16S rRNA (adenine1518-N6/adenine1519-N6)-dimethyltransferase
VRAINPQPGEALVEIGPGLGALTQPLLQRCGALTVIELDRDLAARLRQQAGWRWCKPMCCKSTLPRWRLGGNCVWSAICRTTSPRPSCSTCSVPAACIRDQHFMLQKEVVQRMAASPGSKDYGRLSVMLQWRYHIESVLDVPPTAFDPPPRVDSAVVSMQPLPVDPAVDAQRLSALVTAAFSQRRKLLRHTLGRWLDEQGVSTPFDLQRRAEEVPVAEYLALARRPV